MESGGNGLSDGQIIFVPPGGSKASDHTHLERQNRRLEEELVKLRDQAKQLEKKLREKDNKAWSWGGSYRVHLLCVPTLDL